MAARTGAAHVVTTRRKYKDTVYETHLLRRSYRVGNQVKNETLGNLSHLPANVIDLIRRSLKGERFIPASDAFEITHSRAHGHVQAITQAMQRLGFASLIASKTSPQRDRVMAMVAARILSPNTKLATTRWWHTTTLAETFNVIDADEDDLYAAMDWLLERQSAIEKRLVTRHHNAGERVLYDLSSSYFEGSHCPLAKRGYSRDHRRDKLQVNYGLLTNALGCPMAISAFAGNTADSLTFLPAVEQLCHQYGVERLVMIGDRGMISNKAIAQMRCTDGIDWIADTDQAAKASRDPVAPAKRSATALQKVSSHTLPDGTPAHSFATLIAELSMIVRNTCLAAQPGEEATPFDITTTANEKQRHAFELLKRFKV